MKIRTYVWLGAAFALAGCAGPAAQTFAEKFQVHEDLFAFIEGPTHQMTVPGNLPTGSNAVYTGLMGMTVDVDGIPQDTDPNDGIDMTILPGGDFRAAGDFTIIVNFDASTLSGSVVNLDADEGNALSGTLTIDPTPFVDSEFDATYSGDLLLNGFTLSDTGGTTVMGQFKGPNGEFIWGFHNSVTAYDDNTAHGIDNGTIDGGFVGVLQ
ncbi:MAG: hypothetical protein ACC619_05905 [Paracoccaceae bacterium]